MKLISKIALPIVIMAVLYLLISENLFSINLLLIVQVLAFAVMLWARRSFQPGQFSIHAEPSVLKHPLVKKNGPTLSAPVKTTKNYLNIDKLAGSFRNLIKVQRPFLLHVLSNNGRVITIWEPNTNP